MGEKYLCSLDELQSVVLEDSEEKIELTADLIVRDREWIRLWENEVSAEKELTADTIRSCIKQVHILFVFLALFCSLSLSVCLSFSAYAYLVPFSMRCICIFSLAIPLLLKILRRRCESISFGIRTCLLRRRIDPIVRDCLDFISNMNHGQHRRKTRR